jgi:hypothetical protein
MAQTYCSILHFGQYHISKTLYHSYINGMVEA